MAVGQVTPTKMYPIEGVRLGVASAGIKTPGRVDTLLLEIDEGASVSGVFTKNNFCAAPVVLAKKHLGGGGIRYLVVNSGNANACTGARGLADAALTCEKLAELTGVHKSHVLPFSTGVIGEYLPVQKLIDALPEALANLEANGWETAAKAIMTTDTRPKQVSVQVEHDGETITVSGIAKGAGMIRPDMATMLAYVATDAVIAQTVLDDMLQMAVNRSFNRITVDGDTSTNDACILIATGRVGTPMIAEAAGPLYQAVSEAVVSAMQSLSTGIIRDAEGATKFITLEVDGGATAQECLKVAYAIAHSPLVKTAMYASDANWGRIVAAIGYAGVHKLDASLVKVWLDDVLVVDGGERAATYTESLGSVVVSQSEFTLRVHLGRGSAFERIWTSDLSHDYVTINAEYRT